MKKEQELKELREKAIKDSKPKPRGYYSNSMITTRNSGVRHQFTNNIGGCSDNYR